MRNEHIKDYLWSEMVPSIDNKTLMHNCLLIEKFLEERLTPLLDNDISYSTFTGREYNQYNLFTFPSLELNKLFAEIKRLTTPVLNSKESYMFQSWLNVYRDNGFIDWHGHWNSKFNVIHGFYCVNTEDVSSYTEYMLPTLNEDITTVHSKDGLLVFGKSDNDKHRSSLGWNSLNPRITIAFDIVPTTSIQEKYKNNFFENFPFNHFIPF